MKGKAASKNKNITEKKIKTKVDFKAKKEKNVKKLKVGSKTAKEIKNDLTQKADDLSSATSGERKMARWIAYIKTWIEDPSKSSQLSEDEQEIVKKCTTLSNFPRKKFRFCCYTPVTINQFPELLMLELQARKMTVYSVNHVKTIFGKTKEVPVEVSSSLFDKLHNGFSETRQNKKANSEVSKSEDNAMDVDKPPTTEKSVNKKSKNKKRKSNEVVVKEETNGDDAPAENKKAKTNMTNKAKGKKGTPSVTAKTNGVNQPQKGKGRNKNKK